MVLPLISIMGRMTTAGMRINKEMRLYPIVWTRSRQPERSREPSWERKNLLKLERLGRAMNGDGGQPCDQTLWLGITSQQIRYTVIPGMPPGIVAITKANRNQKVDIPKNSDRPPHTPASMRFRCERRRGARCELNIPRLMIFARLDYLDINMIWIQVLA